MKTMTIRNIPDDVAASLAEHAKADRRSVNATVVDILCSFSLPDTGREKKKYADFSEFCGIMTPEEADAVEKEIEECFEQIDPEDWK